MKKAAIILFLLFLLGCIKESSTTYEAKLQNPTSHKIEIISYENGSVSPSGLITLEANTDFIIANGTDRGIVNRGGFNNKYFSNADSVKVVFDDSFSIMHYFAYLPDSLAELYYNYENTRNLLNLYSYEYSFKDNSKHSRSAFYTYIFTEQDYLDAKE